MITYFFNACRNGNYAVSFYPESKRWIESSEKAIRCNIAHGDVMFVTSNFRISVGAPLHSLRHGGCQPLSNQRPVAYSGL